MRDLKQSEITKLGSFIFEGDVIRTVHTIDGETYFLVYDLCKILGISNRQSLFNSADTRVKASGVFSFDEELNPQRYNLVNLQGLQYMVYRAKVSIVNRLDLALSAEEFKTGAIN